MDTAKCPECGKVFSLSRKQKEKLKSGITKRAYCSHACASKHKKIKRLTTCANCGKEFEPNRAQWSNYTRGINKNMFCSIECVGEFYSGENNHNWKGRKSIDERGYVRILLGGRGCYKYEHRIVMEKKLGRELKPNEDVHHINGNKQDNRPENLMLLSDSEHSRHHAVLLWGNRKAVNR